MLCAFVMLHCCALLWDVVRKPAVSKKALIGCLEVLIGCLYESRRCLKQVNGGSSSLRYADGKSRQAHFRFGGVMKWLSEAETGSLEIVSRLKNLRYAYSCTSTRTSLSRTSTDIQTGSY